MTWLWVLLGRGWPVLSLEGWNLEEASISLKTKKKLDVISMQYGITMSSCFKGQWMSKCEVIKHYYYHLVHLCCLWISGPANHKWIIIFQKCLKRWYHGGFPKLFFLVFQRGTSSEVLTAQNQNFKFPLLSLCLL